VVPGHAPLHRPSVTQRALLLSSELHVVSDNRVDRRRTIMPEFTEGFWNKKVPGEKEQCDHRDENDC
jgi:hypothetical protein